MYRSCVEDKAFLLYLQVNNKKTKYALIFSTISEGILRIYIRNIVVVDTETHLSYSLRVVRILSKLYD
jgi:hypothetical protein